MSVLHPPNRHQDSNVKNPCSSVVRRHPVPSLPELAHLVRRAERDAHVIEHRREWPPNLYVAGAKIINHLPHRLSPPPPCQNNETPEKPHISPRRPLP